jgi:hypothetical protein
LGFAIGSARMLDQSGEMVALAVGLAEAQ